MLTILYSFNKRGYEAEYWEREIAAAATDEFRFVPFNHGRYIDPNRHIRAQLLDDLYYDRDAELMRLYEAFETALRETSAGAILVDTCPPYHPDYLRRFPLYKVLRTADGPMAAYDRDFAYVHAYDHILFHSPAYSRDMGMEEKLAYCGAKRASFWPLALFDAAFDPSQPEDTLLAAKRDIDVIFIGALHPNKMPLLARVKKAFGRRCVMHGLTSLKKNVYFNARFGFPGWIRPVRAEAYVGLYQRSRIGFNIHNRGDYTVGSYRLFDLPGNGVMQISDGGPYLDAFFKVGDEIVAHRGDDLVDLIRYYLQHEDERVRIARNGYRRVMASHRIAPRLREAARLVQAGIDSEGQNRLAAGQARW